MKIANNPELPTWTGSSAAYSKAYRILEKMGRNGHVTPYTYRPVGRDLKGRVIMGMQMHVSQEMRDFIDALNKGDEETIKGLNLKYLHLQ